MSYKFKYTERNVSRGSEFETRALLFMIAYGKNKDRIQYAFIDCFNDLTGYDEKNNKLFDVQSKGVASLTPKKIGVSLITLFENSLIDVGFSTFTLYLPVLKAEYVNDSSLMVFNSSNFGDRLNEVRSGLVGEYRRRNPESELSPEFDEKVNEFMDMVVFVYDHISKSDFIKRLSLFRKVDIKSVEFYEAIFDEVQQIQMAKKRINVEGREVSAIRDVLLFNKHIKVRDISVLIVNRIIGIDIFKRRSIPQGFLDQVRDLDPESVKDLILECNSNISKALFDKNAKREFWQFFEGALIAVNKEPTLSATDIFEQMKSNSKIVSKYMNGLSGIFLLALIKEGIEYEGA